MANEPIRPPNYSESERLLDVATKLLAGTLANPTVVNRVADEASLEELKTILVINHVDLAARLIRRVRSGE